MDELFIASEKVIFISGLKPLPLMLKPAFVPFTVIPINLNDVGVAGASSLFLHCIPVIAMTNAARRTIIFMLLMA
jgi:hypothetical protein